MTDAEVICSWMESLGCDTHLTWAAPLRDGGVFATRRLDLDALHLVEARLTPDDWTVYMAALASIADLFRFSVIKALVHASAEAKIEALAAVLRPVVEEKKAG